MVVEASTGSAGTASPFAAPMATPPGIHGKGKGKEDSPSRPVPSDHVDGSHSPIAPTELESVFVDAMSEDEVEPALYGQGKGEGVSQQDYGSDSRYGSECEAGELGRSACRKHGALGGRVCEGGFVDSQW